MPASQNRSNCAFRCGLLHLATKSTAKSGFKRTMARKTEDKESIACGNKLSAARDIYSETRFNQISPSNNSCQVTLRISNRYSMHFGLKDKPHNFLNRTVFV